MRVSFGKLTGNELNRWARFTPTGEVANVLWMHQARLRFNQNFDFGKFAIYDKTRPVKIINAVTTELLVVEFYDRLDLKRQMVWGGLVDTLETYQRKRGVSTHIPTEEVSNVDPLISLPPSLDNEWW